MWQVSDELKADREFILAAVAQDGDTLKHASAELKADREFILAAVTQDGDALGHASDELKADREVVFAAARQNPGALRHALAALRDGLPVDMLVLALQRLALAGALPQRPTRLECAAHWHQ